MTNPNNSVGTNAGYNGRTSSKAFNDVLGAFTKGIVSGWGCAPKSGMVVSLGGNGTDRDVAIAEDNAGNRTTINNRSGAPIDATIAAAPSTNNRIDAIVAYAEQSIQGTGASDVDFASGVGLIVVSGTVAANPVAPNDTAIRNAITADGATGSSAFYVVLAEILVGTSVTTIGSGAITQGARAENPTVAALKAEMNLTDIQTETLTFNGSRTATVTLAQNASGSLFKFYGQFYFDNNTSSSINLNTGSFYKVAVPGDSGYYGFPTGLFLNQAPSTAYLIRQAGYGAFGTLGYNKTNTGYMDAGNFFEVQIRVGTDGQIYIVPYGNDWTSGNVTVAANTRSRIFWLPMLYWNSNFGDAGA